MHIYVKNKIIDHLWEIKSFKNTVIKVSNILLDYDIVLVYRNNVKKNFYCFWKKFEINFYCF